MDAVNIDDAPGSYCSPLTSFPKSGEAAAGGLVNGRIVVCGGYFNVQSSSECYASGANSWELIGNLTYPRHDQGKKVTTKSIYFAKPLPIFCFAQPLQHCQMVICGSVVAMYTTVMNI